MCSKRVRCQAGQDTIFVSCINNLLTRSQLYSLFQKENSLPCVVEQNRASDVRAPDCQNQTQEKWS